METGWAGPRGLPWRPAAGGGRSEPLRGNGAASAAVSGAGPAGGAVEVAVSRGRAGLVLRGGGLERGVPPRVTFSGVRGSVCVSVKGPWWGGHGLATLRAALRCAGTLGSAASACVCV